jgi:nitric oxide reductase subunit C
MLSKSQARIFFVGGTVLFSLLFLFLTIDTIRKVPAQTNAHKLTAAVKRGKWLWDKNNCMGCHTLLGEGAYYAPELTKVYERRGPVWMKIFLKDPQKMYPNDRKMVQYNFTEKEIDDLIAFFKWIGEMNLNGFPPKPDPRLVAKAAPKSKTSLNIKMPVKFKQLCLPCHTLGGKGGSVGPSLDGVGNKYNKIYLRKWLSNPRSVKPKTTMPKLPLKKAELTELVEFLSKQK